ncbi:MAG: TSUP family transporter [Clostridia bacterium]|nr:TSUP family transporter [Clostridia bacterium]
MIYLLLGGISAYLGACTGLGSGTLLRPLLDAVSPLPPVSIAALSTIAALAAALVSAFFMLSAPLPIERDELILLGAGGALGGIAGDLLSARFFSMLGPSGATLLQNALFFTLIALPAVYFSVLSHTIRPLSLTRLASLPTALIIGLISSFLAFGAQPITIAVYYLFFDAEHEEAACAALAICVSALGAKLISLLIRQRFSIAAPGTLLWLLPGALLGAFFAAFPALRIKRHGLSGEVIRLSLYAATINAFSALAS